MTMDGGFCYAEFMALFGYHQRAELVLQPSQPPNTAAQSGTNQLGTTVGQFRRPQDFVYPCPCPYRWLRAGT